MQISAESLQVIAAFTSLLGSSGAAWVGVKVSLNGTRERVKEIHQDVKETRNEVAALTQRVTRVETRVEANARK